MLIKILKLLLVLFLVSCSMENNLRTDNGFDAACRIFEEAGTKKLDPESLGSYISNKLEKMPDIKAADDVKSIYYALFNVDPAKRYELFKESAETTLNRNWDCIAMEQMYQ